MRKRFVASHPMWGTEYSGPESAVRGAFEGRACVICEKELSDPTAVEIVENIYRAFGMRIVTIYMQLISAISLISLPLRWPTPYWKKRKKKMRFLNWPVVVLKVPCG